jgi:hypothetical protein
VSDVPHEILSEHFQSRMAGQCLVSAVFFTYQFEPGFFEQRVLPVFIDVAHSHAESIRLLQLEDALRCLPGQVAVYYDANGLVDSDSGSARLDIRRIPIRHRTGIFHAKNIFLLTESDEPDEDGIRERRLLAACLSANLTRSGWWENVEACHVEEVAEGDKTRLRDDLLRFLGRVRRATPEGTDNAALDAVVAFLRSTGRRAQRSVDGVLHTHFYFKDDKSVAEFLKDLAGRIVRGGYLEIISPFFDNASRCLPLEQLLDLFEPKETRIFLPRDDAERVLVGEALYESVRAHSGVSWGKLPKDMLKLGRSEDAGERGVHAKIYRFFSQNPKSETVLVGSVNLTNAAHQTGGNLETAFLFDHGPARRPEFWLLPDERRPSTFEPRSEQGEAATSRGVPLVLCYHWDTGRARAWWEGSDSPPRLRLESQGVDVGWLETVKPQAWTDVPAEVTARLAELLRNTSFITVHGFGKEPGLILVQEEGMSHKPSLLMILSAKDILEYWSLLTVEQKNAFLEHRLSEVASLGQGQELMARYVEGRADETLFDRFAGIFHAFGCLERSVREDLEVGGQREAVFRVFGRKHDSLGQLLTRVLDGTDVNDDVHRYVILLCARQLRRETERDYPDFWKAHGADAAVLDTQLARVSEVRERLVAREPDRMKEFLDWFEPWFLRRARPVEAGA